MTTMSLSAVGVVVRARDEVIYPSTDDACFRSSAKP